MKRLFFLFFTNCLTQNHPIFDLAEHQKEAHPSEIMYAHWRSTYYGGNRPKGCVLCACINDGDHFGNFVLKKFKHNTVLLNLYPYTPWGCFMIASNYHEGSFQNHSNEAILELVQLMKFCEKVLRDDGMEGVNIGTNIGKAAGASIPDHLHTHIVSRKMGDMGFISNIGNLVPISVNLEEQYKKYKKIFEELEL